MVQSPQSPPGRSPAGWAARRDLETDRTVWRGLGGRFCYAFLRFLSRIAGILLFDVRLYGAERVPRRGAVVIASNHQSYLDPWLVGMCLPRAAYYLARETLFGVPVLGWILRSVNVLPLPRGRASSRRGIELGRAVLRAGKPLVFFPEGTRSRDGRMGPLKRGVDLVARPARAPVVPAFVEGSFTAWPPQRGLPRFQPVRVFFGEPVLVAPAIPPGGDGALPPSVSRGDAGTCAELLERLRASYRNLKAAAAPRGRPLYFG